jgi:NAD(P)-dependent dehydrogenase (short-subunit alcohol dehydrogenase family)
MAKVWLITGSSRGLGRRLAEAVLASGDSLVATARDVSRLADLQSQYGDRIRVATLDVTDQAAAQRAVQIACDSFGTLDILVNNAGFGYVAPFEQASPADIRSQFETNFFGVVNMTQAVLPLMRGKRAGHIINVSSVGGRMGIPGFSVYQAAKWAVSGLTESLAQEAKSFGVNVIAIEPGGMLTDWADVAGSQVPELLPEYQSSVGLLAQLIVSHKDQVPGDPVRISDVILEIARHENLPAHLLLGSDALQFFEQADSERAKAAERWREVSLSTDRLYGKPIPVFPDR